MIDEKKLIHALIHDDGICFQMDFNTDTEETTLHSLREFAAKLKEGIVDLINAQPKEEEWISAKEKTPTIFESVLIYTPGDSP